MRQDRMRASKIESERSNLALMGGERHAQKFDLARDRAWRASTFASLRGEQRLVEMNDPRLQAHGSEAQGAQARGKLLEQFGRAGDFLPRQPDLVLFRGG